MTTKTGSAAEEKTEQSLVDKFLYVCPQFMCNRFETLEDYLAYSEGEHDYLFGDPEFTLVAFDTLEEYQDWFLSSNHSIKTES